MEWFEVGELADEIAGGRQNFDALTLEKQFLYLLEFGEGIYVPINELTLNEFHTDEEAKQWLRNVFNEVFAC
ncbi:MAG: hypothetical protein KDH20_13925 [Rhodocyclaceae bacterium]|nr:hypothetical protein [Rhodocyclaceae bacterium]